MIRAICLLLIAMALTPAELAAKILTLPPALQPQAVAHLRRIVPTVAGVRKGELTMRTTLPVERRVPEWAERLRSPAREKGASGGRGSGKSHFFAEELVEKHVENPARRSVCIREIQRSLQFSSKALIEAKIRALGVSDCFEVTKTEIRRVGGTGIIIFEGMQDHTAESIKSLEGFDCAWVEEAQNLSEKSLDMLKPTIRAPGSELWFSWNPELKTDPVDQFFANTSEGRVRVHCTYLENPWCTEELLKLAADCLREEPEKYPHIWLGKYNTGGKGRVYSKFAELPYPAGNMDESVHDYGGTLYIGQDFNVNPMSSVLACKVGDECHVFDALAIETSNTTEVCEEIQRRYPGRHVVFCPDPAGNQRRSSTTKVGQTDFTIIRSFGFEVRAPLAHPPVVDRINNANMMYAHENRRRVRINPAATVLVEGLNGLKYKPETGLPNKKSGFDHICDAMDYLLWQEFNVAMPAAPGWGTSRFRG